MYKLLLGISPAPENQFFQQIQLNIAKFGEILPFETEHMCFRIGNLESEFFSQILIMSPIFRQTLLN